MGDCPFDEKHLLELKAFIAFCNSTPEILHHEKLSFFKDYLISLGANIPAATFKPRAEFSTPAGESGDAPKEKPVSSDEESEPEEELVLDNEGVIEPDEDDPSQEFGDPTKESTEEELDAASEKRSEAMAAFSDQDFAKALQLYTEAIKLNPQAALLYAKRGQVYLKLNKPNACIKDCNTALELNPDSAAAYKFRGWANRLLGNWLEAAHDLSESCKIDYDDQVNAWLQEVKPNADKLRAHLLAKQRRQEEKEHRAKLKKARAAREKAKASYNAHPPPPQHNTEMPFDLLSMLNDPVFMDALKDPELKSAFEDIMVNPANIVKYQNNPKIVKLFETLQKARGGAGAGNAEKEASQKPQTTDDVGLD